MLRRLRRFALDRAIRLKMELENLEQPSLGLKSRANCVPFFAGKTWKADHLNLSSQCRGSKEAKVADQSPFHKL